MRMPVTRRRTEESFGKRTTTRVRRLIGELSVFLMLEMLKRLRLTSGKLNTSEPSGMFCSAQVTSCGALVAYACKSGVLEF